MRLHTRVAILTLVLLSIGACGGSPSAPTPLNVSGTWTGSVTDNFGGPGSARVALTQTGTGITGTWVVGQDRAGENSGQLSGSLSGSSLQVTLTPSNPTLCPYSMNATVSGGTQMAGTYAAFNCTVTINGTVTLTKQ